MSLYIRKFLLLCFGCAKRFGHCNTHPASENEMDSCAQNYLGWAVSYFFLVIRRLCPKLVLGQSAILITF